MTTFGGNFNYQIVLQTPTFGNPILVTGSILDPTANQAALFGSGIIWTITNQGVIENTSTAGTGIQLLNGGDLTNSSGDLIQGSDDGADGFTNVTNYGTIAGTTGFGLQSGSGGTLTNAANAIISGGYRGVGSSAAAVSNAGVIRASQTNGTGLILYPANSVVTNTATIAGGYVGMSFGHAGTVINTGTITGTTGRGVFINAGGYVGNAAGKLISGAANGVMIFIYGSGTVTNAGTIAGTGTGGTGVSLRHGGNTTNASTGLIQGGADGADGATNLSNYGTIIGTGAYGAQYGAGGAWLNAANAVISGANGIHSAATLVSNAGLIRATASYGTGVHLYGTTGTVVNSATIVAGYDGVRFDHAGTVINTGTITGTADDGIFIVAGGLVGNAAGKSITGANFGVDFFIYGSDTLSNAGAIVATGSNSTGVTLRAGGTITNAANALIQGGFDGADGATDLSNYGTIVGTGRYGAQYGGAGGAWLNAANAVISGAGGIHSAATFVSNAGLIRATATHSTGAHLYGATGTVVNSATIVAGYDGVRFDHAGTVINTGTITGTAHNGIFIGGGGYVGNAAGKSIMGTAVGVQFFVYGSDTLFNAGTILATAANSNGVFLQAGGTATNAANALIQGNTGAVLYGTGSALVNFGTIAAVTGDAVYLGSHNGRVIAEAGAVFSGEVAGIENGDVLELASGRGGSTLSITGFTTVQFDSGAQWTIEGSASQLAGAITGFGAGDTIDLTGFVAVSKNFTNSGLVLTDAQNNQVTLGLQGSFSTNSFTIATGNNGTGTLVTLSQSGPQPYLPSDPLMTNTAGSLVFDQAVGGAMVFTTVGGLGPEWEFDGSGNNLLGDGNAGFLIRDAGNVNPGALYVGEIANGAVSFTAVGGLGPEWQFEGTADFLGDGQSQFLIRNTGGVIGGAMYLGQVTGGDALSFTAIGGLGLEWQFDGDGDFLGDGRQGFLFRNVGTVDPGAVYVGEVVNGQVRYTPIGGLGVEWDFEGTGDFLGDGRTDFLIWNSGNVDSGAMAIGEVANGQLSFTDIGGVGPEWQFVGTGNYVDINKTDFLLRNTGNGALAVGSVSGSVGDASVSFTIVGGIGPEWTFHNTSPALLT